MVSPAQFVLTLLHSVTNAHILHLKSLSYSEHKALQAYYEGVGDLVDDVVEVMQGKYDLITDYPEEYKLPPKSALDYLIELNDFVFTARKDMPQDSELQNDIDAIASLIDSTVYKLRFLK